MKKTVFFIFFLSFLSINAQDFAQYVNPFIGTGGHGHTFPGATLPFGMVQLSPDTRIDGSWDGCSGYHYSDSIIYGFSHTHLNGTGVSDFGDILLMPTMGTPSLDPHNYASSFSHKNEKAEAGFYSVKLNKYDIEVQLTATKRVGYHEYTFNKTGTANIILDLNHRDKLLEGEVRIIDEKTVEVFRRSEAWATDQNVYARIEFSKPMNLSKTKRAGKSTDGVQSIFSGNEIALALSSSVKKGEKIMVKVSISPTGYEGAEKNMRAEGNSNDFESIKKQAQTDWNKELSKIEVTSADRDKLAVFYTALYHTMMQPNIAMDVDGKYRGLDRKIHTAENFGYYSVFSLWDTFRAYHPLMTLIDKKRTSDFINTFIRQYEEGGRLPVWELAGNETFCMIGYHSVSVISDAMVKGIQGFDYEKAFEAAKKSAMEDHFGLNAYKQNGYISVEDEHENVSKTLEYAYDDWCIAQMALILGKNDDYQYFMKRSQGWKNLYNPETGFMQARKNGNWVQPFEPREVNNNFTEGNSWHYSFFVPQDIEGLISAHGGKANFEKFLDRMFSAPEKTTGREQADLTGLIGQYAQGNEPSHHIAYLYNFVDQPAKTDEKVKFILDNFYKNTPDGLIGNEDCGQMSAWVVLSAMGIYPVTPGKAGWETTKPYFEKIKINFENGTSKFITSETPKTQLQTLGFENLKTRTVKNTAQVISAPLVTAPSPVFDQPMKVELKPLHPKDCIFYLTMDEDDATVRKRFIPYKKPLLISKTTTVSAYSENTGIKSSVVNAVFYRKPNNWSIETQSVYNPQYDAGGKTGLIDGVLGDENWRKGNWQGFQSQNFVAVVDLKMQRKITEISSRYLQDSRSWILMPAEVEYYLSSNNIDFFRMATVENTLDPKVTENTIREFRAQIVPTEARYLKIVAKNFGKLPEWHQGYGGEAFIFVDEIEVK